MRRFQACLAVSFVDAKTHGLFSSTANLVRPAPVPGKKHLPKARSGSFRLMVVTPKSAG
jgi:hypothetical protein